MTDMDGFEKIKHDYDLVALALAVQPDGRPWNGRKKLICPFHPHKDLTPSLWINPDGKSFRCHNCGARGSVADWLGYTHISGWRGKDTPAYLMSQLIAMFDCETAPPPPPRIELAELPPPPEMSYVDIEGWSRNLWEDNRNAKITCWLTLRGIGPSWGKRFKLGFTGSDPRLSEAYEKGTFLRNKLVIPWFVDGDLVGVKLRNEPWEGGKGGYMSLPGSQFADYFFNQNALLGQSREIYINETELDSIALCNFLGQDVSVAKSANSFEEKHSHLFTGKRSILIRDNDEAGKRNAARIKGYLPKTLVVTSPVGKDLGDAFKEGITPDFLKGKLTS